MSLNNKRAVADTPRAGESLTASYALDQQHS